MEEFFQEHPIKAILIVILALLIIFIVTNFNGCTAMMSNFATVTMDCSYTANDRDILAVESRYRLYEKALQKKIDNVETENPGYDETIYWPEFKIVKKGSIIFANLG